MSHKSQITYHAVFFLLGIATLVTAGIPDAPFVQEFHQPYPLSGGSASNDVRSVAVDAQGNVWAATRAGFFRLEPSKGQWQQMMPKHEIGPCFTAQSDPTGRVWIGAWNGLYTTAGSSLRRESEIDQPITAVFAQEQGLLCLGPNGMWSKSGKGWEEKPLPYSRQIRALLPDPKGGYWVVTGMGLYHQGADHIQLFQSERDLLSPNLTDLAYDAHGRLWIGGLGGITVFEAQRRVAHFAAAEGLPSIDVQAVTRAPDGRMWVGTKIGIARFDGKSWSLLHSRRWLLHNDVRDIAFAPDGTAWIATAQGVSAIRRREMTLVQKEAYYRGICMERHVRDPGLVEKCRLVTPGDLNDWEPQDDDNDGQYTSMYLAMEAFRYAVTQSEDARQNAQRAFAALRFLQTVTDTPGFVARTVIPSAWTEMADRNVSYTPQQWADHHVRDPRNTRVEQRWRLSRDGKWRWKGDTSSDEITGHMYGYLFYYDLVAQEEEKKQVAAHVCKIVDYIVDNGYVLKDIDGTHTRWGVWSPEKLNHDPDWRAERYVNSVEILSYLKLAYHVSGKKRYQKAYLQLLHEHHYADNVRQAKSFNPGWITHIDDELLALAYPCLLLHESDPELKRLYQKSLQTWYAGIKADKSPYFEYTYASLSGRDPLYAETLAWFQDVPLDLIRWRVDNSQRADISLVRIPEFESAQTSRMLPPSERSFYRWDRNPWYPAQGDGGRTESDGVFWMLPYWMGRYYGYIGE
jgi:streptogramin lyase